MRCGFARFVQCLEQRRLFDAGSVDATFGGDADEPVVIDHAGLQDIVHDVSVTPTGQVLVVGNVHQAGRTTGQMMFARFNADGTPDTSLGGTGEVLTTPHGLASAIAVALAPDGSFYVLASHEALSQIGDTVLHYSRTGKLDRTFNFGKGQLKLDDLVGHDLALDRDGRLLVSGTQEVVEGPVGRQSNAVVRRYNPNGTSDPTFGGDGDVNQPEALRAGDVHDFTNVGVDNTGGVVVTRVLRDQDEAEPGRDFWSADTMRFDESGQLDASFGADGIALGTQGLTTPITTNLSVAGDGRALVRIASLQENLIQLLDTNGVDPSVDVNDLGNDFTAAGGIAWQSDGKALLGGLREVSPGVDQSAVARFNTDGTLDTTFGDSGFALAPGVNNMSSIAIGPDGSITTAGVRSTTNSDVAELSRLFVDDAPVAIYAPRDVREAGTASAVYTVDYRDDDAGGIDVTTLDNRDLRVTGPGNFVAYAKFVGQQLLGNGVTRATYKMAPIGGAWDAADNGVYSVRLQDRAVEDLTGNGSTIRVLGTFRVSVPLD